MLPQRFVQAALSIALITGLTACDPGVHVAWEQDFHGAVDFDCIERALRAVASKVDHSSYQSDGNSPRGFASGIIVTQFGYTDPRSLEYYTLDVAKQPTGQVHYWNEWSKIGTHIEPDEQQRIVPFLNRANKSVEQRCGLSFAGTRAKIGSG